jgi:hypothetical protein
VVLVARSRSLVVPSRYLEKKDKTGQSMFDAIFDEVEMSASVSPGLEADHAIRNPHPRCLTLTLRPALRTRDSSVERNSSG